MKISTLFWLKVFFFKTSPLTIFPWFKKLNCTQTQQNNPHWNPLYFHWSMCECFKLRQFSMDSNYSAHLWEFEDKKYLKFKLERIAKISASIKFLKTFQLGFVSITISQSIFVNGSKWHLTLSELEFLGDNNMFLKCFYLGFMEKIESLWLHTIGSMKDGQCCYCAYFWELPIIHIINQSIGFLRKTLKDTF